MSRGPSKSTTLDSWLKPKKPVETQNVENESPTSQKSPSTADVSREDRTADVPTTAGSTFATPSVVQDEEASSKLSVPKEQHIPANDFTFPRSRGRACQSTWFRKYKWLHYDVVEDSVLCFTCVQARKFDCQRSVERDLTFECKGFKNWKKGPEKFETHAKSSHHRQAVEFIIQRNQGTPVYDLIVKQSRDQQVRARTAMLTVLSSVRYLARTGQALRGLHNDDGNFRVLIEERCEEAPELKAWCERRNNYLDGKIQNEILEIMAHKVQRLLVSDVKKSPFYGIICDGTTDVAGNEQLSLCIRWNDSQTLEVNESFVGMYRPQSARANDIFEAIKDMLTRLGLSIDNLRGHCFDGAANMSGHLNGVQKKLNDIQPKSLYVHCSNHSLDLALQEITRRSELMCDAMILVKEVTNTILESSKRRSVYSNVIVGISDEDVSLPCSGLLPLCPTRWAVRVKAVDRFLKNYQRIQETLKTLTEDRDALRDERKSSVKYCKRKMQKTKTLFCLKAAVKILGPCEQLAQALQKPGYTAMGAKSSVDVLLQTLSSMRTDMAFQDLWHETEVEAGTLGLKMAKPKRPRKIPRRLEQTDSPSPMATLTFEETLRKCYFEVLDNVCGELERRFCQPSMEKLVTIETIVSDSVTGNLPSSTNLTDTLLQYGSDFDIEQLSAQLLLLPRIVKDKSASGFSVINELKSQSDTVKDLLDQVVRLLQLLSVVPASAASAERSFSALRRVKTYLRSTMTQKRLTHLLLLHVHSQRTSKISLGDVLKEFISRSAERQSVFGNF